MNFFGVTCLLFLLDPSFGKLALCPHLCFGSLGGRLSDNDFGVQLIQQVFYLGALRSPQFSRNPIRSSLLPPALVKRKGITLIVIPTIETQL